jgi:hypothetical protein
MQRLRRNKVDTQMSFSVLLPERFSAFAPYTFGTQFNGILQSPLPFQFSVGILKGSSGAVQLMKGV